MKNRFQKDDNLKRVNKKSIMLNNREKNVLEGFCKKYKITNQGKFMRETVIKAILKQYDEDYPTLFDDQPNLFSARNY